MTSKSNSVYQLYQKIWTCFIWSLIFWPALQVSRWHILEDDLIPVIVILCVFTAFSQAELALYLIYLSSTLPAPLPQSLFYYLCVSSSASNSFVFESSKNHKIPFSRNLPQNISPFWLPHLFHTYLYSLLYLFQFKNIIKCLICGSGFDGKDNKGSTVYCIHNTD